MSRPESHLAVQELGDLLVLAHTRTPPSDAEWDRYLVFMRERERRVLVFTDGGGPNGEQRKRLNDAIASRKTTVAVVSGAPVVRFIVASVALLSSGVRIRAFAPDEVTLACQHLGITPETREELRRVLLALREQMGAGRVEVLERALQRV